MTVSTEYWVKDLQGKYLSKEHSTYQAAKQAACKLGLKYFRIAKMEVERSDFGIIQFKTRDWNTNDNLY